VERVYSISYKVERVYSIYLYIYIYIYMYIYIYIYISIKWRGFTAFPIKWRGFTYKVERVYSIVISPRYSGTQIIA